MNDRADADRIVDEALGPFFSQEELPSHLGREIYLAIRRRLRAAGHPLGDEHADEVFQRVLVAAYAYLARHGGNKIQHVRGWLHRISVNAARAYLSEYSSFDSSNVALLLERELPDDFVPDDLKLVSEAVNSLRPLYREVIRLELSESRSPEEIQKAMNIASPAYFRKLKHEAFKALREEISRRVLLPEASEPEPRLTKKDRRAIREIERSVAVIGRNLESLEQSVRRIETKLSHFDGEGIKI